MPYERKANSQKIKINKTPIHFAIDGGSLETIKLLVENKGVDINEKYILYFDIFITFDIFIIFIQFFILFFYYNIFIMAVIQREKEVIQYLLENKDVDVEYISIKAKIFHKIKK